ncbi:hypothetical protein M406DRAFT_352430 [Cryphonectria parasitica EP155]|uniref:Uncharacterized protein n=1 Tax=Cryphonectria parasitica (strain ATCC 38755 / EP155) TaxID=660469 RepID=A0A9P4XZ47_CRYP1|nr:uncharacterized protein M406DRAFT_352430 [Cryphonectria parasitica EP155]KAF3763678.1 hypothetical protein M406DRAFT_352430 [Cryphonectria parasitica EP155]
MSQQVDFLVAFATVVGGVEAIRQVQAKARRQEHRSRKNNLVVHCPKSSQYSAKIEGKHVVLSGGKLYVDTGTEHNIPFGHPFAGYYLPFPGAQFDGLVSTIHDDPPIMNWICVNRQTYEVQYGERSFAEQNFKGPFDVTRQDRRLTMGGWEGFVAVLEGDFFALYFDLDDDRLKSKVAQGTPVIEVELQRIEMRAAKPAAAKEMANGHSERANSASDEDSGVGTKLESPEVD